MLPHFVSPESFHRAFPVESADEALPEGREDPFEVMTSGLPRGAVLLAQFCRHLHEGQFDEDIANIAHLARPLETLEQDDGAGELGKAMREVLRALLRAEAVVAATPVAAPGPSLRSLLRQHSDPDEEARDKDAVMKERADVWKQAQTQRRKFVTLGLWKEKTLPSLHALFKKAGATYAFEGALNEQHRGFFYSADLVTEKGKQPWKQPSMVRPNLRSGRCC